MLFIYAQGVPQLSLRGVPFCTFLTNIKSSPCWFLQRCDCDCSAWHRHGHQPLTRQCKPAQHDTKQCYSSQNHLNRVHINTLLTSKPFCFAWLQYFSKCSTYELKIKIGMGFDFHCVAGWDAGTLKVNLNIIFCLPTCTVHYILHKQH